MVSSFHADPKFCIKTCTVILRLSETSVPICATRQINGIAYVTTRSDYDQQPLINIRTG